MILSDEPILYPYVTQPDILVVMSQEAYTRFAPELKPGGILIIEQDLVQRGPASRRAIAIYGVPATRLAEELGRKVVLNIVMVGFFGAVTGLLDAGRAAQGGGGFRAAGHAQAQPAGLRQRLRVRRHADDADRRKRRRRRRADAGSGSVAERPKSRDADTGEDHCRRAFSPAWSTLFTFISTTSR